MYVVLSSATNRAALDPFKSLARPPAAPLRKRARLPRQISGLRCWPKALLRRLRIHGRAVRRSCGSPRLREAHAGLTTTLATWGLCPW